MPTLPLYHPPQSPDAWHRITAPGGYECWHFDAESNDGRLRIVADLFQGCPFDGRYVREYRRYRRWPTRFAPPVPADHAAVHVAVFQAGSPTRIAAVQIAPDQFAAQHDGSHIIMGQNRVIPDRGALNLDLVTPTIQASIVFHNTERLSRPVHGTITCDGRAFPFQGHGYHDHYHGLEPLGMTVKRWIRGRVLLEDAACAFQLVTPVTGAREHVSLLEPEGQAAISSAEVKGWRLTHHLIRYPGEIAFGEALKLSGARVLDSTWRRARLIYEANWRGRTGEALCELIVPPPSR